MVSGKFVPNYFMKLFELLLYTHEFIHHRLLAFFGKVDEILHVEDTGNFESTDYLAAFTPLKAVFGNIDGKDIRDLEIWEMKRKEIVL